MATHRAAVSKMTNADEARGRPLCRRAWRSACVRDRRGRFWCGWACRGI